MNERVEVTVHHPSDNSTGERGGVVRLVIYDLHENHKAGDVIDLFAEYFDVPRCSIEINYRRDSEMRSTVREESMSLFRRGFTSVTPEVLEVYVRKEFWQKTWSETEYEQLIDQLTDVALLKQLRWQYCDLYR